MNRNSLHAAVETTWAMSPTVLARMMAMDDAEAAAVAARRKLPRVAGQLAVIPIHGMISQRASIWQELFGGTATEAVAAAVTRAAADERIGGIVLDVDSPGGTVAGVEEAAAAIFAAGRTKPMAAVANSEAASAAYWLASQVGSEGARFSAAPGADVGSIGVYRLHEDYSEMLAADGVKLTFLATPEFKVEGNPYEPLSDEARAHHMEQIEATYDQFVRAVSRGRGVTTGAVKDKFGRGRMFESRQAAAIGLVDRVASLADVIREMGAASVNSGKPVLSAEVAEDVTCGLCRAWNGEPQEEPTEYFARRVKYWP